VNLLHGFTVPENGQKSRECY